jgi:hypothetical protein
MLQLLRRKWNWEKSFATGTRNSELGRRPKRIGEKERLAMSVAPESGRCRIMIYGPKNDGTYVVEFKTAAGEAVAISIPASETRVIPYFQERMPYGLFVPDVDPRGV